MQPILKIFPNISDFEISYELPAFLGKIFSLFDHKESAVLMAASKTLSIIIQKYEESTSIITNNDIFYGKINFVDQVSFPCGGNYYFNFIEILWIKVQESGVSALYNLILRSHRNRKFLEEIDLFSVFLYFLYSPEESMILESLYSLASISSNKNFFNNGKHKIKEMMDISPRLAGFCSKHFKVV